MQTCRLSKFFLCCVCVVLAVPGALAQSSPYSLLGIGNFLPQNLAPQQAMGNLGTAYPEYLVSNIKNPAWLARNRNTIFDVATTGQYLWLVDEERSQTDFGMTVSYFSLTLALSKRWSTAVGLMPYTQSNYRTRTVEFVPNTPFEVEYTYQSSGGINTLFWGHGVLLGKSLYMGVRANYLFGAMESETQSMLLTANRDYQLVYYTRLNPKGWSFTPGLAWRQEIGRKKVLNVGATYSHSTTLRTNRFEAIERRSEVGSVTSVDTLFDAAAGSIVLPNQFSAGFSIELPSKWMVGVEMGWQQWENYRYLSEANTLKNTMSISVGGVYTPDFRSVDNFFQRISYRAGFQYQQLPYELAEKPVEEFGINFGISMPVGVSPVRFTYLHLNLGVGQRGHLERNGLQERFVRMQLAASLSDLMWFKRPKYD